MCDVCYMLFIRGTGGEVSVMCAILGCAAQVCLAARCCPMWVSSYCLSISDVYCWWAFAMGDITIPIL